MILAAGMTVTPFFSNGVPKTSDALITERLSLTTSMIRIGQPPRANPAPRCQRPSSLLQQTQGSRPDPDRLEPETTVEMLWPVLMIGYEGDEAAPSPPVRGR